MSVTLFILVYNSLNHKISGVGVGGGGEF